MAMTSLAILGAGKVGGETAYLSAVLGLVDEIVLYDVYEPLLRAQVLDLQHTGLDLTISTEMKRMRDADIFVFAAGTPRTPEVRTRADLFEANVPLVKRCAELLQGSPRVIVTVTNPMDANNYGLWRSIGIDRERCIGFGGQLDSARFTGFLREAGISAQGVVLGEHGGAPGAGLLKDRF